MIKYLIKKYSQFIRFGFVGVLNTAISLVIYNLFIKIGINYLVANAIGYVAGILNGYVLSSKLVFKCNMNINSGSKFILTYMSSFILGTIILYILVEYLNILKQIAPLFVAIFNIFYNYIINKKWTFK